MAKEGERQQEGRKRREGDRGIMEAQQGGYGGGREIAGGKESRKWEKHGGERGYQGGLMGTALEGEMP